MTLPSGIRLVGATTNATSYKITDAKVDGGEALVTIFTWDADGSVNAHCMACDAYKCKHADTALRFHRDSNG